MTLIGIVTVFGTVQLFAVVRTKKRVHSYPHYSFVLCSCHHAALVHAHSPKASVGIVVSACARRNPTAHILSPI